MQRSMRKFQISDKIGEGKPATVVKEVGAIKKKPDTLQHGRTTQPIEGSRVLNWKLIGKTCSKEKESGKRAARESYLGKCLPRVSYKHL